MSLNFLPITSSKCFGCIPKPGLTDFILSLVSNSPFCVFDLIQNLGFEEEQVDTAGKVAEIAFKRGYHVSARVHVYLFGNAIGT